MKNRPYMPEEFDPYDDDRDEGFKSIAVIAAITTALWIVIIFSLFYFS